MDDVETLRLELGMLTVYEHTGDRNFFESKESKGKADFVVERPENILSKLKITEDLNFEKWCYQRIIIVTTKMRKRQTLNIFQAE
ncbi:hypothetical protein [Archaeoglobus sp.]